MVHPVERLTAKRQIALVIVTAVPFYDNAGTEDGSVAMEELCLLLRLAAHVVADPGEGETPLMPLAMAHASSASAAAGQVSHNKNNNNIIIIIIINDNKFNAVLAKRRQLRAGQPCFQSFPKALCDVNAC